ncbi:MAG: LON peptidase substrate-binding domain-containing protein [Marinilabiliales bacterium]|nr:LON peptidase substrate-binding domain-containing protein [Marinilabiliales bacterium]
MKAIPEAKGGEDEKDFEVIIGSLKDLSVKIVKLNPNINPEASFAVKNIENSTYLINYICANTEINVNDKQKLLEATTSQGARTAGCWNTWCGRYSCSS